MIEQLGPVTGGGSRNRIWGGGGSPQNNTDNAAPGIWLLGLSGRDARPNGVTLMLLGAAYAMLGNDTDALATWRLFDTIPL